MNYFRTFSTAYKKIYVPVVDKIHKSLDRLPPRRKEIERNSRINHLKRELDCLITVTSTTKGKREQRLLERVVYYILNDIDRNANGPDPSDFNRFFSYEFEGLKKEWISRNPIDASLDPLDYEFSAMDTEKSVVRCAQIIALRNALDALYENGNPPFIQLSPNSKVKKQGFLTVKEYADLMNISTATVKRHIKEGKIKASKQKNGRWVLFT